MKLTRALFVLAIAMAICFTMNSFGQRPQPEKAGAKRPAAKGKAGAGQKGGGGQKGSTGRSSSSGNNLVDLASVDAVQKEVELVDEQIAEVKKLSEALREERSQNEVPNLQNATDEEREKAIAEIRQRRQDLTAVYNQKLAEVVLPHQYKRLREISVQVRGVSALSDSDVATQLKLTDEQKQKIEEVTKENSESLRAQTQELLKGRAKGGNTGNREEMQAKMKELRSAGDDKVLAILTSTQKTQFEALKGEKFDMPEGASARSGQRGAATGQKGAKGPAGKRAAAANGQGGADRPQPNTDNK